MIFLLCRNYRKRKLSWIYFINFLVYILFSCAKLYFIRFLVQLKTNYPVHVTMTTENNNELTDLGNHIMNVKGKNNKNVRK